MKKFLGYTKDKTFNPAEQLEVKRVIPFVFMTQQLKDQMRKSYQTEASEVEEQVLSLGDLLREGWQGRRFYKIAQKPKDVMDDEGVGSMKGSVKTVMNE